MPAGAQGVPDAELIASARQACADRDFNSLMSNFARNTRVQARRATGGPRVPRTGAYVFAFRNGCRQLVPDLR